MVSLPYVAWKLQDTFLEPDQNIYNSKPLFDSKGTTWESWLLIISWLYHRNWKFNAHNTSKQREKQSGGGINIRNISRLAYSSCTWFPRSLLLHNNAETTEPVRHLSRIPGVHYFPGLPFYITVKLVNCNCKDYGASATVVKNSPYTWFPRSPLLRNNGENNGASTTFVKDSLCAWFPRSLLLHNNDETTEPVRHLSRIPGVPDFPRLSYCIAMAKTMKPKQHRITPKTIV